MVDTAADGRIAVEKVRTAQPGDYHLILMDIQMPVMNGHEATAAIRALPVPELAQIPIIALSANAFEEDRKRAVESGMDAYMTKPFSLQRVESVLQDVLKVLPPAQKYIKVSSERKTVRVFLDQIASRRHKRPLS